MGKQKTLEVIIRGDIVEKNIVLKLGQMLSTTDLRKSHDERNGQNGCAIGYCGGLDSDSLCSNLLDLNFVEW